MGDRTSAYMTSAPIVSLAEIINATPETINEVESRIMKSRAMLRSAMQEGQTRTLKQASDQIPKIDRYLQEAKQRLANEADEKKKLVAQV